ncbi:MAG: hypothetical protein ACXABD_17515 [Candidatus Thorarchaeota archaeon]|jgi:hypothetical protein
MAGIRDELLTDPLGRGYAAMTDQEAADDLNTEYRTRNRTSMTGDEVFQSIESQVVWGALTDNQRLEFLSLCGRETIDPFGSANVDLVKEIFGSTSPTVTALAALRVEAISRAVELGLPTPVRDKHVASGRA